MTPGATPSARPSVVADRRPPEALRSDDSRSRARVTRVESAPDVDTGVSRRRGGRARRAQAQSHLEGPPISDTMREARAEARRRQTRTVDGRSSPPRPRRSASRSSCRRCRRRGRSSQTRSKVVSSSPVLRSPAEGESDADLDQMREGARHLRKREQDARCEILARRRAEHLVSTSRKEAKQARRAQRPEEEERAAACIRHGTQDKEEKLDLRHRRRRIDDALDAPRPEPVYPPPPPPPSSSLLASSANVAVRSDGGATRPPARGPAGGRCDERLLARGAGQEAVLAAQTA